MTASNLTAVARAKVLVASQQRITVDYCLQHVRELLDVKAGAKTAYKAWLAAGGHDGVNTHYAIPAPAGVPLFLKGKNAAGHICLADGNGGAYTTDYPKAGRWGHVADVRTLARAWNMDVLGWSETLNGVRVYRHVAA